MRHRIAAILALAVGLVLLSTSAWGASTPSRVSWFKATAASSNTVTVNWAPAAGANRYELSWREMTSGRVWVGKPPAYTDYRRGPVTLTGLKAGERYQITIRPYRDKTAGPTTSLLAQPVGVHIVCAAAGGNSRYFVSFLVGDTRGQSRRPGVSSASTAVFGDTAGDGWVGLPAPWWSQPGTVVTSIDGASAEHGAVARVELSYAGSRSQAVRVAYREDCSFSGFPS